MIRSYSHPELLVSETGRVFCFDTGQEIKPIRDHQLTTRGYVVQFKAYSNTKRIKTVSLLNLVYETHVKGSRIATTDVVRPIDGNDFNPLASNLYGEDKRKGRTKKENNEERYSTWLNGDDELFM